MSVSEQWNDAFTSNYGSPRLLLTEGKGLHVKDGSGREYRDFLGGIATNIVIPNLEIRTGTEQMPCAWHSHVS